MISAALVLKELRAGSRRWTTYLFRGLYVGIAALLLWFVWDGNRGAFDSPSQYAQLGRMLFSSINSLQVLAAVLGAMLGCSDSITGEVRAGTLGLVLMTPLSPLKVVLAKWSAVLFQTLTLLLSGAPALAICAYLGGVGPLDLAQSIGGCLLAAGFGAALAIHGSSKAATAARAFVTAFLRIFLFYLAWIITFQILIFGFGLGSRPSFFTLALLQYSGLGLMLLLIPALLGLAARNTRRRLSHPERWNAKGHAYETTPSYYSKIDRDGKRLVIKGGVWESRPLLWKDLATRSSGRIGKLSRILATSLLGILVLLGTLGSENRSTGFLYFTGSVLLLLAVLQGSSLFAPENSGRRWDMLLTAPVSSSQIVGAKLASGLVSLEALVTLILLLLPLGLYVFFGPYAAAGWALGLSTLVFLAFAYLLAAFISLHSRNSRNAFMAAGGILAFLLVLPAFLPQEDGLWTALNPALLYENSFLGSFRSYSYYETPFDPGRLPYFLFQWGLYGGAAALLALGLCRRFRAVATSYA